MKIFWQKHSTTIMSVAFLAMCLLFFWAWTKRTPAPPKTETKPEVIQDYKTIDSLTMVIGLQRDSILAERVRSHWFFLSWDKSVRQTNDLQKQLYELQHNKRPAPAITNDSAYRYFANQYGY